jgi:hypothetical protein
LYLLLTVNAKAVFPFLFEKFPPLFIMLLTFGMYVFPLFLFVFYLYHAISKMQDTFKNDS